MGTKRDSTRSGLDLSVLTAGPESAPETLRHHDPDLIIPRTWLAGFQRIHVGMYIPDELAASNLAAESRLMAALAARDERGAVERP